MSRLESDLPSKFYQYLEDIPVRKWWRFIRLLGLPENEIDDIMYEGTDLNEQKYQMLARWRNMYGHNKQDFDVCRCLEFAKREILQKTLPDALNRELWGTLLENRTTARAFYSAFDRISHEKRKKFASIKLKIDESEYCTIEADYPKDKEEQFYQMLLSWKRGIDNWPYNGISSALGKYVDEFLNQSNTRGPNPVRQVTSDGMASSSSFSYPEAYSH